MYNQQLDELDTFQLRTEDLNNDEKLNELYDYLDLDSSLRVYPDNRVHNQLRRTK